MPDIIRFQTSHIEPYPLEVVGESFHRSEIEKAIGFLGEDEGIDRDDLIATLILDDKNPADPNAVRVEIAGRLVGYLSRPAAKRYRAKIKALNLIGVTCTCWASVRGGFYMKSQGRNADFGIRLDMDLENLAVNVPTPQVSAKPAAPASPKTTAPAAPKRSRLGFKSMLRGCLLIAALILFSLIWISCSANLINYINNR